MIQITELQDGIVFILKVVPGSSKTELAGVMGDKLKIRVAAAPEKGKANECVIDFLSKILKVKKNAVAIVSGQTKPIKQIRIDGINSEKARQLFDAIIQSDKRA